LYIKIAHYIDLIKKFAFLLGLQYHAILHLSKQRDHSFIFTPYQHLGDQPFKCQGVRGMTTSDNPGILSPGW